MLFFIMGCSLLSLASLPQLNITLCAVIGSYGVIFGKLLKLYFNNFGLVFQTGSVE